MHVADSLHGTPHKAKRVNEIYVEIQGWVSAHEL